MTPRRVAIIGTTYPDYELHCPNWRGMQTGLFSLGVDHALFTCRPELDIDSLVLYNPDLVVYGLIDMVRREDWRHEIRMRLPNAKIVLWYGDYRGPETGQIRGDISELDFMFVSNDGQNEYYERLWNARICRYLPLGAPIYSPKYDSRFDFPFVFIGAHMSSGAYSNRSQLVHRLKTEHGLKLIDGPANTPRMREKVFKAMPTIYRSSKISLDWSHFTDIPRYTSNRHWIITASNGLALTKRFPGCEENYPEGTRIYFDTLKECEEKLMYYLAHPNEADVIRAAGYAHAKNHTYDKRFARMFEMIYD